MGGAHPQDHIDGPAVAITAVSAQHQGPPLHTRQRAKRRLDETLQVIGLLELAAALAQAGGPWLLVCEGGLEAYLTLGRIRRGRGGHHEEWDYLKRKHGRPWQRVIGVQLWSPATHFSFPALVCTDRCCCCSWLDSRA